MKKAMILSSLLLAVTAIQADDYGYLMFQDAQGARTFVVSVGTEITFVDGMMVASNATTNERVSLSLSDLDYMLFTTTNEADKVEEPQDPVGISHRDMNGASSAQWFDLSGRRLLNKPVRSGVYVVKTNGRTVKVKIQ